MPCRSAPACAAAPSRLRASASALASTGLCYETSAQPWLAYKLKIETIAEGVETAAQRDILTGFGCDYLQGYLYARPLSRPDFEALLLQPGA